MAWLTDVPERIVSGRTKMGEKEESSMAELAVPIPDSIKGFLQ